MSEPKILIVGTGRCGTTFLMELFVRLGLAPEDGYDNNLREVNKSRIWRDWDKLPWIVKNPLVLGPGAFTLPSRLPEFADRIRHVIWPIRDLGEVWDSFAARGAFPYRDMANPLDGYRTMAGFIADSLVAMTLRGVPFTTLAFPRFTTDGNYLADKLLPIFPNLHRPQIIERALEITAGEAVA